LTKRLFLQAMPSTPSSAIVTIWTGLVVVWVIGALTAKATLRRRQPGGSRAAQLVLGATAWWVLVRPHADLGALNARFIADHASVQWTGVALATVGAAFTLWARVTLGGNWSGTITVKRDHELITSGPYAIVRHPIYSGLLLTLAGTALVVGEWRALIAVPFAFIAWRWKSLIEEQVMIEQFGPAYEAYKVRVKALIPFVL